MTDIPLLSFQNVQKRFGKHYALKRVNFDVEPFQCVSIVGENGAGKSTLLKILSGIWPHGSYKGQVLLDGKPIKFHSTLDARRAGISIIHQELCLFPELTVAENLFLTEEAPYHGDASKKMWKKVDWKMQQQRADVLFRDLGFDIDPMALVKELGVAQRQLVEIARSIHQKARVVLMDEPSSALSEKEVIKLYSWVERMQSETTFLFISHKMDEVFRLSHKIVVLRDGETVGEMKKEDTSEQEVVEMMVGRSFETQKHERLDCFEKPVLKISNWSHWDESGKQVLDGVDLEVGAGEIVGVAGLMGAGRTELLKSILTIEPGRSEGTIEFCGKPVQWDSFRQALLEGVGFVSEDRKKEGLFLDLSVGFNMSVSILGRLRQWRGLAVDSKKERKLNLEQKKRLKIKTQNLEAQISSLSGGNQQKALLARMLLTNPKCLFLDEPTRGIDMGAKEEIYNLIRTIAREKQVGFLVVSSELPEILTLSDRVLVLKDGKLTANLPNQDLTQVKIMNYAAGVTHG